MRCAPGSLRPQVLSTTWQLDDAIHCARILLMVSRFDHCRTDLPSRWRMGSLGGQGGVVVSDQHDLARLADTAGRRVHIPVTIDSKPAAEEQLLQAIGEQRIDLVMVAR